MNNWNLLAILVGVFTGFLLSSCGESTNVGIGQIDNENFEVVELELAGLQAKTVSSPPDDNQLIRSRSALVGRIDDPIFGTTTSSYAFQADLRFTDLSVFNEADITLDSIVLMLDVYDNFSGSDGLITTMYGNENAQFDINVYEITTDYTLQEELNSDQISALAVDYEQPIGTFESFNPQEDSSFSYISPVSGDSLVASGVVRIPLSDDYGTLVLQSLQELSNTEFESVDELNEQLQSRVNNFLIRAETNDNALLGFAKTGNIQSLELYYTRNDTARVYSIIDFTDYYDFSTHDYSGTTVESALMDNDTVSDNYELYIQGLWGTVVELDFSSLQSIDELENIIINNAELLIPVAESSLADTSIFPLPNRLVLYHYDTDSNYVQSLDYIVTSQNNGFGSYFPFDGLRRSNTQTGEFLYRMNVTALLNQLIEDNGMLDSTDYKYYLSTLTREINGQIIREDVDPSRVIIHNSEHPERPLTLTITYTKP